MLEQKHNQRDLICKINLDVLGRPTPDQAQHGAPVMPHSYSQSQDDIMDYKTWNYLFEQVRDLRPIPHQEILWHRFQHVWCSNHNDLLDLPDDVFRRLMSDLRICRATTPIFTSGINLASKAELIAEHIQSISTVVIKTPYVTSDRWQQHYNRTQAEYSDWLDSIRDFDQLLKTEVARRLGPCAFQCHIWITGIDRFTLLDTPLSLQEHSEDYDLEVWHSELDHTPGLGLSDRWQYGGWEYHNHCNLSPILQHEVRPVSTCRRRDLYEGMFASYVDYADFGFRNVNQLNVASNGDCYVCIEDYHQKFVYGNINNESLPDIWRGDARQSAIQEMLQTQCQKCQFSQ